MTAAHIVDPASVLGEALSEASPDMMRHLLQTILNALLSADADAVIGAEWGQPSPTRTARRNGYRHRDLDTRVGTLDLASRNCAQAPTSPTGSSNDANEPSPHSSPSSPTATSPASAPDAWLPRCTLRDDRSGRYPPHWSRPSASTGCRSRKSAAWPPTSTSSSTTSATAPLNDAGPFTFVTADALTMKVREGGHVVNTVVLLATGVNHDGHREVLGLRVAASETGSAWNEFFADLLARGLTGVLLVTSFAHTGLREAINANLPGASWQRLGAPPA